MSRAIVGSAILAMEDTSTDMLIAMATASMARQRSRDGSPSAAVCTSLFRPAASWVRIIRWGSASSLTVSPLVNKLAAHEPIHRRVYGHSAAGMDRLQRSHESRLLRGGLRPGDRPA